MWLTFTGGCSAQMWCFSYSYYGLDDGVCVLELKELLLLVFTTLLYYSLEPCALVHIVLKQWLPHFFCCTPFCKKYYCWAAQVKTFAAIVVLQDVTEFYQKSCKIAILFEQENKMKTQCVFQTVQDWTDVSFCPSSLPTIAEQHLWGSRPGLWEPLYWRILMTPTVPWYCV